jgi:two-component system LytT family sensor kinase
MGDSIPRAGGLLSVSEHGWILIAVFWASFGFLMIPSTGDATLAGQMAFTFLGASVWAVLTLPLFSVTERFDLTNDEGAWRWTRVASLIAFGLVVSLAVSWLVSFASAQFLRGQFSGRLVGPDGIRIMLDYRITHDILACNLVLAAGVARDYLKRYRTRLAEATLLRSQLAEARLEVLQSQLNPHFLFNALNAVAALVQKDPAGARRMIALLSDLLRETLNGAAEPQVPLEKELDMLRRYLAIMEIRFRGTLETRIVIDPEAVQALVPTLILQPLVENALKHGVSRASGRGVVELTCTRDGLDLVLRVRNTGGAGDGLGKNSDRAGVPSPTTRREGGFGLWHTRERLQQLYGERAALHLTPAPDGATIAEIRLPYRLAAPASVSESEMGPQGSEVPDRPALVVGMAGG